MANITTDIQEGLTPLLAIIFAFAGAASNKIVSLDFVDFGLSLTETLVSLGSGTTITLAGVLMVVSFGTAYGLNNNDVSSFSDIQTYTVAGTAVLVLGMMFVPALSEFVTSTTPVKYVVFMAETAGFALVSGYNG